MLTVRIHDENDTIVVLNFEELIEDNDEYIDDCIEIIYSIPSRFKNIKECHIDEPQDYFYLIQCSSGEEACNLMHFLNNELESLID